MALRSSSGNARMAAAWLARAKGMTCACRASPGDLTKNLLARRIAFTLQIHQAFGLQPLESAASKALSEWTE
jgi:hypothetical protein